MDLTALTGAMDFGGLETALAAGFVALIGFAMWKTGAIQVIKTVLMGRRA